MASNFYLHFTVRLIQWLLITEMSGTSTDRSYHRLQRISTKLIGREEEGEKNVGRNLSLLPSGPISRPMEEDSFDWKEEAEV